MAFYICKISNFGPNPPPLVDMTGDPNAPLRARLSFALEYYLSAVSQGATATLKFDQYWADVTSQVITGIQEGSLEEDVLQLAYNSATLIAACGNCIVACEETAASMISDTENALARLTLDEAKYSPTAAASCPDPTPIVLSLRMTAAYEWLKSNVHNPYPSFFTKQNLASQCGLTTREIHEWFKEVRRNIGWIDFCKKHFQGSRSLAIEAASQVLLKHNTFHSVSLEIQVDVLLLQGRVDCLSPTRHHIPDGGDDKPINPSQVQDSMIRAVFNESWMTPSVDAAYHDTSYSSLPPSTTIPNPAIEIPNPWYVVYSQVMLLQLMFASPLKSLRFKKIDITIPPSIAVYP